MADKGRHPWSFTPWEELYEELWGKTRSVPLSDDNRSLLRRILRNADRQELYGVIHNFEVFSKDLDEKLNRLKSAMDNAIAQRG